MTLQCADLNFAHYYDSVKQYEKALDLYQKILKKVPLNLAPGVWHTLTLKFDGINLDGEIGGTKFSATDKIFEREKGGVDFLLTGGEAGFRNFSLTSAATLKSPAGKETPK